MKLTIMRGISGSGKSTRAQEIAKDTGAIVVSRDDIRFGMFGTEFDPEIEEQVSIIERGAIEGFLKAGKDVVSDNTYIDMKYVNAMAKLGYKLGAQVEVVVVDVPLKVAKKNNDHRAMMGGRYVPEDVIERQHAKFQSSKNTPLMELPELIAYNGTPGKPKAFLVDIDGTLAHMRDYRGPFDWDKVGLDDLDEVISNIVLYVSEGSIEVADPLVPIVMSGRDESSRAETEAWLNKHCVPYKHLYMRPAGNYEPDNIVKHKLFNELVRDNYDVQFVLDDRQQVVDMWRSMGLTCLQVAPGDF